MMHTKKNRVSDSTSNVYRILALFFAFLSFLFSLAGLAFLNSKNSIYDQPELIKNVVFIIIGLGGLSGAWWLYRMHKWRLKQVRNYPNEPWMWNPSWSKGLGQNEYSVRFLSLFIAGSFFLGVGGFALIQVWPQILKTPPLFLLLIFPALGLLLIFFSLKMLHAERKFGTSKCHLNTRPGFLGEELFVTIEIPYNFSQRASFKAHLSNTYTYSSGSGNSRHSHTDTLWSSHQSGQVPPHQPKTEIPLRFIIPTDAQPTKSEGSAQYDWTVEIYIPLPGADYQQSFRVPVFFDPQRSSTHNLTKEDLEGQEDQRSLQGFVRADLLEVQVKHLASGATRYSFVPQKRLQGLFVTLLGSMIAITVCGAFLWMGYTKVLGPKGTFGFQDIFGTVFMAVPVVILTIILIINIYKLYSVLLKTDLIAHHDGLMRKTMFLGSPGYKLYPWKSISAFELQATTKVNGRPTRWALRIQMENEPRSQYLMGPFKDKRSALWLQDQLKERLSES